MNELSVNTAKIKSNQYNMVGTKTKQKIREYFEVSAEQVKAQAEASEMDLEDFYADLNDRMKELKRDEQTALQNEKTRIRKLMDRFIDGTIDEFDIRLDRLGKKSLKVLLNNLDLSDTGKFLMTAYDGDEVKRIWTYNSRMANIWEQVVDGSQFTEIVETSKSDEKIVEVIRNFDRLVVSRIEDDGKVEFEGNQLKNGAYFPYYHKLPHKDLSRFGIYSSKAEAVANGNYKDNCFYEALRFGGASEEVLQVVRTKMKNRYIKNSDIKPICAEAGIYVEVKCRRKRIVVKGKIPQGKKPRIDDSQHGDKSLKGVEGKSFMLGLVCDHFFLNEELEEPISNYCLKNWNKMKDNLPYNYGRRAGNRKATKKDGLTDNSFKLVEKLLDDRENLLTKIPRVDLLDTQYYDQNKSIETLTFGDENVQEMEDKLDKVIENHNLRKNAKIVNVFVDFETNTKARQAKHTIDQNGNITSYNTKNKKNQTKIRHKAFLGCMKATYYKKIKNKDGEVVGEKFVENDMMTFYDKGLKTYRRNGENCVYENTPGRQMVKHIADTYYHFDIINIIAHNAGYDLRVGLFPYLYEYKGIENGNQLILGSGNIYPSSKTAKDYLKSLEKPRKHIPVKIKCSYKMTDIPLKKFGKVFKLPQPKEVMPYDAYTTKNVNLRYIDYKEFLSYVKEHEKKQFLENVNRWKLYDSETDKIDIIGYAREYCKIDVDVMRKGYEMFREHIKQISLKVIDKDIKAVCKDLFIDIYSHYTISSVANEMMLIGGCYEGTCRFAGVVREFIQKCVVGGRVMTRKNEKVKVKYEKDKKKHKVVEIAGHSYEKYSHSYIYDVDATSLYPSSLFRIPGFIKGIPKILPDMKGYTNREEIINILNTMTNDSHYFLEININRVGIDRKFPLMSYTDGLTRKWTNEVIGEDDEPIAMYCDRTMLEDWIEFHDIDFKIVRGYYFDEGYNPKINTTMKFLFEERVAQKKLKNPIQNTIKLLMNSGYGKTLEKAHEDAILYKTDRELKNYLKRKYNFVKEVVPTIDGRYKCVEWSSIDRHYNQVHQGVSVLSMSKRIMSEVMCLAEDNDYDIYYTDTDSIHMDSEDSKLLYGLWDKKYGGKPDRTYHRITDFRRPKHLLGVGDESYLGQFHNDFDLDGVEKKKEHLTRSVCFIGLGKKCYVDILEGFDEYDKLIEGFHIRMKGVSEDAILWKAKQRANQVKKKLRDGAQMLYENLYKGNSETFDLCVYADGSEKLCFKFFNDFTIGNMNNESTTKEEEEVFGFTRTIQFQ